MTKNKPSATNIFRTPCYHTALIRETAFGSATGNYICTHCGCLLPASILAKQIPAQFMASTAKAG
jgi:hypothetical protein